jgi:hypothetical protein
MAFLADGAARMIELLDALDAAPIASFAARDEAVWSPEVATSPEPGGGLGVQVTVKDAAGLPQASASVRVWLDVDDFTRIFDQKVVADAEGKARVIVPQAALAQGGGSRWIHVTAGKDYPLAERIAPVATP